MKMIKLVIGTLCLTFIASTCMALELSLEALKDESNKVPKSYAKVLKYTEDNIVKEKIVFGESGSMYGPSGLNNILEAYGVKLHPETLEDTKVPSSYAKVVKFEEGEEVKEKVIFSDSGIMYGPSALNQILEAYGVKIKIDSVKNNELPSSYAMIVETKVNDKVEEKVVFRDSGIFYGPTKLNQILMAYE